MFFSVDEYGFGPSFGVAVGLGVAVTSGSGASYGVAVGSGVAVTSGSVFEVTSDVGTDVSSTICSAGRSSLYIATHISVIQTTAIIVMIIGKTLDDFTRLFYHFKDAADKLYLL